MSWLWQVESFHLNGRGCWPGGVIDNHQQNPDASELFLKQCGECTMLTPVSQRKRASCLSQSKEFHVPD